MKGFESADSKEEHGAVACNPMAIGLKLAPCSVVVELVSPTASTGQGGDLARRRYQKGQILFSKSRQLWLGRHREDTIRPDGSVIRARPQIVLGTKKELPTQRLAARKLDEILSRINDCAYQPTRIATVAEFAARWREEVLAKRKPSTVRSANSHLDSHILPQLGKLRLDQVGPENQQVFVNQLAGASRKTVLNILSTLSSMLATAKNWRFSSGEIALRKLVLPERNVHVPAHFTRSQVESILSLANEPWRTFLYRLGAYGIACGRSARPAMAGYRLSSQMHSRPPLCVVRESSIHKEQGECSPGDFAGRARKRFEAIPLDLDR